MVKKKCVFLDRDGVVNRSDIIKGKPFAPTQSQNFIFLPKVKQAIKLLKENKYLVIIITNQPDLSNGKMSKSEFNLMTEKINKTTAVDDLIYCPHLESDNCKCRKPLPGMILHAAKKYNIDLKRSFMIGDRKKDIEAGQKANCKTIYIQRKYIEKPPKDFDFIFNTLYSASNFIINHKHV